MAFLGDLAKQLEQMRPIARNMAICCAIDMLGDEAVDFVAEPFKARARQIIAYRKLHRMSPYGPNRERIDA